MYFVIERKCTCEMGVHRAPLEKALIGLGVINELPEILKAYDKIYIVCDETTYRVLGERVEKLLLDAGKKTYTHILKGKVLPNEHSVGDVLIHLCDPTENSDVFSFSPLPDFILGVGSGVINDICRLVSYRVGVPYGIAGTAPSMDGYASAGSPVLFDGTKATIKCTTPKYIIADLDVMKDAPFEMLLSGIGDMFGKYTGLLDWELARDYNGEYFCPEIASEVLKATDACLKNGYDLKHRDPKSIKNIMDGFMVTGLGMAFTGNSRPASGSEHIIAHAWELGSVERGESPKLHGLEVCEATQLVAEMYRLLYSETKDEHLKILIKKYLPYFDAIDEFCEKMQLPRVTEDYDTVLYGIHRALTLRDRYTILFYLNARGDFERYAKSATERLLARLH